MLRSCWKSRHKNSRGPAAPWTRPGLAALLWLCVTQLACGSEMEGDMKYVVQKDAEFDVTYNDTVTSGNQTMYAFNHTVSRNKVSLGTEITLTTRRFLGLLIFLWFLSIWLSDGGSACVRGRVAAEFGESYSVCGTAETSCDVFSSPSHSKRPVSNPKFEYVT